MARRKNVKRIDPRYFLHETVDRNEDGSALEERFPGIGGAKRTPGMELQPRPGHEPKELRFKRATGFKDCATLEDHLDQLLDELHDEEAQHSGGSSWSQPGQGYGQGQAEARRLRALLNKHCPERNAKTATTSPAAAPSKPSYQPTTGPTGRSLEELLNPGRQLRETGADVKAAGLDPQSLGDTGKVIAQVVAMLKGGEVTPENGPRIDQALERRLKKNPSPEEVSHLQDLRAQVKDAAGISNSRSQRRQKYRSAASDAAAAETARARKPVTSLSSMGIGQEE